MLIGLELDWPLEGRNDSLIFTDRDNLIYLHLSETLDLLRRRPFDLDEIDGVGNAEPKMKSKITLGHHTRTAVHLIYLRVFRRNNAHTCSNRSSVALGADKLDFDPVLFVSANIMEQRRGVIHIQD